MFYSTFVVMVHNLYQPLRFESFPSMLFVIDVPPQQS